jgi:hypothetical protein
MERVLMSLTKAIHIQCDACGRWLRDANSGAVASRIGALSYAALKGWTHGTRDLCPVCTDKQRKTVPDIFEETP